MTVPIPTAPEKMDRSISPLSLLRPAAWLLALAFIMLAQTGGDALARTLASVRIGPHKNFDRMVFEFDGECQSFITSSGDQKVEVLFKNAQTAKSFSLPALPPGLVAIKSVDAFRVGNSDITFEITLARDASASELPLSGKPWRLAIDLSPKMSQSNQDKPEYIPGDQPIQTKFAETTTPATPPATPPIAAESTAITAIDPAKARAVLAYFYLAGGDTPKAREFATAYKELTGEGLDIPLPAHAVASGYFIGNFQLTAWWLLGLAALAGMIGGVIGSLLAGTLRSLKSKLPHKAASPRELSEELETNLAELEQTVKAEATPASRAQAPAPEKVKSRAVAETQAAAPAPAPEEEEVKESLMDRRVRRVLELNKQNRPIAEIAAELEMGQDEVKLILDLNS
jgi:hypothetical protein